jgi:signal transduction histidine kinase
MQYLLSRLTLRMRLAILYGALFSAAIVAVVATVEVIWPDFLRAHSSQQAPPGASFVPGPDMQPGTHSLSAESALFLVVVIAGSLILGWLIAGRNLRPLRAIISTSREISARNLHSRLALTGPRDEFLELGETLDGLFGRLEASFESQRRFVANASHELRTPLAAERTLLQVALADPDASSQTLREACEEALELGDQQEQLISALLTLASSERGIERWSGFDLAELAGRILAGRDVPGITVTSSLGTAAASGDERLAESLVANLIDNALRHNVPGGSVTVTTAVAAGRAVLTVSNTGPLVPSAEVDRLFQPFQRLNGERLNGGHGLGLAIVRAIAEAHGASLVANPRPEGGLEVSVSFSQSPSA